ncbi:terminase small subunit [Georgenia faecalis]|uniref:Terminase small subunit actinomycetes phage-type domain-containing protein n=1 Tax=Georgenia faecalis TaxID=2483799 RepID=A0ABV9D6E3_9MICO|nr:hypothetical protein [Georgenia faecalis]
MSQVALNQAPSLLEDEVRELIRRRGVDPARDAEGVRALIAAAVAVADRTVRAGKATTDSRLKLDPTLDAALIASAQKHADSIDAAVASEDADRITNATYLTPHLLGLLRQMGATPKVRREAGGAVTSASSEALARLQVLTGGRV